MNPRRVFAVVLRQLYLMKGSASRLLPIFVWVAVDMALWGFLTRYLSAVAVSRVSFSVVFLGAIFFWDVFNRIMVGVSMAFFEDVWSRNFLNFFSTPLSVSEYLAGLILTSLAAGGAGIAVMLALGSAAFGFSISNYGLAAGPFLITMVLFGVALGTTAAAMVLRLGPAAEWFAWAMPAVLSPFAGVFYPVSLLPGWMRFFSKFLPPSYVFEALRRIVGGQRPGVAGLAAGGALAVVDVLLAGAFFAWVWRYAMKTGLLARYSAESVS